MVDLGTACDLAGLAESANPCPQGQVCVSNDEPGKGTCYLHQGSCERDANCTAPARCQPAGKESHRLIAPLARVRDGGEVFLSAGRCTEDLGTPCDQAAPACGAGNGALNRRPGLRVSGCTAHVAPIRTVPAVPYALPSSSSLRPLTSTATASAIRSTTVRASPIRSQADGDGDGVGDACQVVPRTPTATDNAGTYCRPTPVTTAAGWGRGRMVERVWAF